MKSRKTLNIGVIGAYGGQGRRILSHSFEEFDVYFHIFEHDLTKKRKTITNITYNIETKIENLLSCEGIIIACPTEEHFSYLDFFIKNKYQGYILCEKPPVETSNELEKIREINQFYKERIMFGFNLRYSIYQQLFINRPFEHNLGKLLHCSFISGQGLGFKDTYEKSWRNDVNRIRTGIFETLCIHYIDLFIRNLGEPQKFYLSTFVNAPKGKSIDNLMCNALFAEVTTVNIFNSYTTPLVDKMQCIYENGIIEIDQTTVIMYYPRDCFDNNNYFISPPMVLVEKKENGIWNDSINQMMGYFYRTIDQQRTFTIEDFEMSMKTMEFMLKY